jgi:hypothetical protein
MSKQRLTSPCLAVTPTRTMQTAVSQGASKRTGTWHTFAVPAVVCATGGFCRWSGPPSPLLPSPVAVAIDRAHVSPPPLAPTALPHVRPAWGTDPFEAADRPSAHAAACRPADAAHVYIAMGKAMGSRSRFPVSCMHMALHGAVRTVQTYSSDTLVEI